MTRLVFRAPAVILDVQSNTRHGTSAGSKGKSYPDGTEQQ